jgi:glycopeptide antibiotics resistance protein
VERRLAGVLLFLYALGAAALTLSPYPDSRLLFAVSAPLHGIAGLTRRQGIHIVEPVANVLLFVPLGLLLCWVLPRAGRWRVWALCVGASTAVEAVQAAVLPHRTPSLIDVATNSAGAALGALIHWVATSAHRRSRAPLGGAPTPRAGAAQ